jgi:hypothetical protein
MKLDANIVLPEVTDDVIEKLLSQRQIIPREGIEKRLTQLAPVARDGGNLYPLSMFYPDVHRANFLTSPPKCQALPDLTVHSTVVTLHRYGYANKFAPTLAEVIIMLPKDLPPEIIAFETVGPKSQADFLRQTVAVKMGFHVASTILYSR